MIAVQAVTRSGRPEMSVRRVPLQEEACRRAWCEPALQRKLRACTFHLLHFTITVGCGHDRMQL